jgi:hypothetical protein
MPPPPGACDCTVKCIEKPAFSTVPAWDRCCPHCGRQFAKIYDLNAIRLGPGFRICGPSLSVTRSAFSSFKGCGRSFADGSKEWATMTAKERRAFFPGNLLPLLAWYGGMLGIMLLVAITKKDVRIFGWAFFVLSLFFGAIFGIFCLIAQSDIAQSNGRYRGRNASPMSILKR